MAYEWRKSLLNLYVKNPVEGRVKTRLAATLGHTKATAIYRLLLAHAKEQALLVPAHKAIWYGDALGQNDLWEGHGFAKHMQVPENLGNRMAHTLHHGYEQGYERQLLLGTDIYQLNAAILTEGFEALAKHDVVIGPSTDGGYYCIGLRQPQPIFGGKAWSTPTVYADTVADIEALGLSYHVLPTLTDVDDEADLHTMASHPQLASILHG